MSHRLFAIGLFVGLLPGVQAQTADPATRELIERLLTRIDGLERRVAELEKGGPKALATTRVTPAAPAPSQAPSPTQAMPMSHDQAPVPVAQPEPAQPVYPSLKIAGFGDINFSATDFHGASSGFGAQTLVLPHSGFEERQFTLPLISALSP